MDRLFMRLAGRHVDSAPHTFILILEDTFISTPAAVSAARWRRAARLFVTARVATPSAPSLEADDSSEELSTTDEYRFILLTIALALGALLNAMTLMNCSRK